MGCPVHRDSRLCIVPPHMLRVLEMRGDRKTAAMARRLLDQSCKIRDERAAIAARPMLAEDGELRLDWEDELIARSCLTHDGEIRHEPTRNRLTGAS